MSSAVRSGACLHRMEIRGAAPATLARFCCDTLGYAAFACRDGQGLTEIRGHAVGEEAELPHSPGPLFGWDAFAGQDDDSDCIVFGLGLGRPGASRQDLRGQSQLLSLPTRDPQAIERFSIETLGSAVSDHVRDADGRIMSCRMRFDHEHPAQACYRKSTSAIDHHRSQAGEGSVIEDCCNRRGERRHSASPER